MIPFNNDRLLQINFSFSQYLQFFDQKILRFSKHPLILKKTFSTFFDRLARFHVTFCLNETFLSLPNLPNQTSFIEKNVGGRRNQTTDLQNQQAIFRKNDGELQLLFDFFTLRKTQLVHLAVCHFLLRLELDDQGYLLEHGFPYPTEYRVRLDPSSVATGSSLH